MQPLRDLWTPSDCPESTITLGCALDQSARLSTLVPSALHYRACYSESAWRRLDPNERAAVLLVAEGRKPAAWAPLVRWSAPDILRRLHLATFGAIVYRADAPPDALRALRRSSTVPALSDPRLCGELFGYPRCCVERFITDGDQARQSAVLQDVAVADLPAHRFWRQLDAIARQNGQIPAELIYSAIGFIPCHPFCKPARARLLIWQQTFEAADPPVCAALAETLARGLANARRNKADFAGTGESWSSLDDTVPRRAVLRPCLESV